MTLGDYLEKLIDLAKQREITGADVVRVLDGYEAKHALACHLNMQYGKPKITRFILMPATVEGEPK